MVRPKQQPMRALVDKELDTLQKVARSRSESAEVVARAKSLLAVAGGADFAAGARAGGRKSGYGVGKLVRRFNRDGVQALQTRPGSGRRATDADNARFAKTLRKQRRRLLTFLYHEAVAPTNNAAERELRPAVIVRKTGGCNRTDAGAEAHAVLASVLRTCQKQGFDPVEVLKHLLHSAETLMFDLVAKPKRGATLPPAMAPP